MKFTQYCFFLIFFFNAVNAHALEFNLNEFSAFQHVMKRPAFMDRADSSVIERRLGGQKDKARSENWDSNCPVTSEFLDNLLEMILERNKIQKNPKYPVTVIIDCNFSYGLTKAAGSHTSSSGVINITAAALNVLESIDELAFLITHELSHLNLAHDEEILAYHLSRYDIGRPMGDAQELEADQLGMLMAAKAGFDPDQASSLFHKYRVHTGECIPIINYCPNFGEDPFVLRAKNFDQIEINNFDRNVSEVLQEKFSNSKNEIGNLF